MGRITREGFKSREWEGNVTSSFDKSLDGNCDIIGVVLYEERVAMKDALEGIIFVDAEVHETEVRCGCLEMLREKLEEIKEDSKETLRGFGEMEKQVAVVWMDAVEMIRRLRDDCGEWWQWARVRD